MIQVKSDGTQFRTSSDTLAGEWKMLLSAFSTRIADRADRSNSATIDLERKCACAQSTDVNLHALGCEHVRFFVWSGRKKWLSAINIETIQQSFAQFPSNKSRKSVEKISSYGKGFQSTQPYFHIQNVHSRGVQPSFDKRPYPLLCDGSRAARVKIAGSGILKQLN